MFFRGKKDGYDASGLDMALEMVNLFRQALDETAPDDDAPPSGLQSGPPSGPPPWADVKPEILTCAADIKVPAAGPIQILEIMPAHHAGSSGYLKSTGKAMVTDVIFRDLAALFPGAGLCTKPWEAELPQFGENFGHEAVDYECAIIYPGLAGGGAAPLRRSELRYAAQQADIVTVNADLNMLAMLENKAAQAMLVADDPALARYFAPAIVLPTRYDAAMTQRIFAKLGGDHESYVVKPVEEIQGNGVRIVAREKLDDFLKDILGPQRKRQPVRRGRDFWHSDVSPVFVVQPLVESQPVMASEPEIGEYDGTLRVFMTFYRRTPDEDFSMQIHDGYWKLPDLPLEKGKSARSLISSSPYRPEDHRTLKAVFNRVTRRDDGVHHAARMGKETREKVFADLHDAMPRFVRALRAEAPGPRMERWLADDDPALCGTALMMAVHPHYYINSIDSPVTRNAHNFPAEFVERLQRLQADQADHPAIVYMQHMLRDVTRPMAPAARDHLWPLAQRYQSDRHLRVMADMLGRLTMGD